VLLERKAKVRLWLDDRRYPWKDGLIASEWAKTADRAIELLKTGKVTFASLDHDLVPDNYEPENGRDLPSKEKTGYDVVCWMEDNDVWPRGGVVVHSMNPVARERMQRVINRHYLVSLPDKRRCRECRVLMPCHKADCSLKKR
jgi:hypothetical protein